jgi:hypothetical protein
MTIKFTYISPGAIVDHKPHTIERRGVAIREVRTHASRRIADLGRAAAPL